MQPDHFDALQLSGVIEYQLERYADAAKLIGKAIEANPNLAPPYSNLGLALQKLGRPQEALSNYDRALALQPDYFEALLNRGNTLRELARFQDAVDSYDRAIAARPNHAEALNNRGLALGELRRLEEALVSLDSALASRPGYVDALNNRGTILCGLKRFEEALAAFDRAIALESDRAQAHNNRGAALGGLLRHEEALASYGRALALEPGYAEAHYNHGVALSALKKHDAALASYDRALDLKPDYAEALNARGTTLRNLARHPEALASHDRAIAIRPDFPEALDNRGIVLALLARHEEALASHEEALRLRPEFLEALSNRAAVLRETGERCAAIEGFRHAVRVDPKSLALRFKLLMAGIPILANGAHEIESSRSQFLEEVRMLETWSSSNFNDDEQQAVGAMQPFHLAYQEENNREMLGRYGRLCSKLMARWQLRNKIPIAARLAPGLSKMRLGIVSAHVHNHSVWNAIVKGWLQQIDRSRFEIDVFHLGNGHDEETDFAMANCHRFHSGDKSLIAWAQSISERQLDVLIYPEIGMDITTPRLASMRLAPVQIAAWGHPETTGIPTIDYYWSAECFEAPESQECYTEKLVPLPNLGCYYTPENVATVETNLGELGVDTGSPVFICPGTAFKYAPQHDQVFVDIARQLGDAQFVFFTFESVPLLSKRLLERLSKAFEAADLDCSKFVVFLPWQKKAGFYAILRQADAFLDTLGFSGFNTAMQAIECGLPIVTREGRFMRGKFASAILKRMKLRELVADSDKSYVDIAVRLARDRAFNAAVREKIRASRPILYRDSAPIRALEDFLIGLKPDRAL